MNDIREQQELFQSEIIPPKIDDEIDVTPDLTFKTDMINIIARVDSVILCISDGEVNKYFSESQFVASPLIEVAHDNIIIYHNISDIQ